MAQEEKKETKKKGCGCLTTLLGGTAVSTVLAAVSQSIQAKDLTDIYKRHHDVRVSYIDSLSDEELENTLIQIGELEAKTNNNVEKTK